MPRDYKASLEDMLESIGKIERYTAPLSFTSLRNRAGDRRIGAPGCAPNRLPAHEQGAARTLDRQAPPHEEGIARFMV